MLISGFFIILQLSIISVATVHASQSVALGATKTNNKAGTDELLEVVHKKETTSDEIIALIDKGADVNAQDQHRQYSLIWAARNGLTNVCIALIDKGADTNTANDFGHTPLHQAALYGHGEVSLLSSIKAQTSMLKMKLALPRSFWQLGIA